MNVSPSSTPASNSRRMRKKSLQGGRAGRAERDRSPRDEERTPVEVASPTVMSKAYAVAEGRPDKYGDPPVFPPTGPLSPHRALAFHIPQPRVGPAPKLRAKTLRGVCQRLARPRPR